jgi:Toprim domain-containing protein
MLGVIARTAIKFDPIAETLAIGEGVETCLAARELGIKLAWALGSVGAISFFPLVPEIRRLVILAEKGNESERAAKIRGTRWRRAGRRAKIARPVGDFSDLNDSLIAERVSR